MHLLITTLLLVNVPLALIERSRVDVDSSEDRYACSQSVTERDALMSEAEKDQFHVRRVEFIGLTYTRDQQVRDRMTPLVQEGDLFSQAKLVKSLQSMSSLKTSLNPIRLRNVVVKLDRAAKTVDMIICFKQKPRLNNTNKATKTA